VFWSNDPLQNGAMTFLSRYLTQSNAWSLLQEYGVGRGTVATAVVLPGSPGAALTDANLKTLVSTYVANGTLPPADPSTIYVLFTPAATKINYGGGQSCSAFGGYHEAATLATSSKVSYAVVPRCSLLLDDLTVVLSHELAEAATDPLLTSYNELNDPYGLWLGNLNGSEIGDLCEHLRDYKSTELGSAGSLSRSWSNSAAAAFKNPCVPAPAGPSFFAIPIFSEAPTMSINGKVRPIELVTVPEGQSRTIPIHLYSPTVPSPNWTVAVTETPLPTSTGGPGTPALSFSWVEAPSKNQVIGSSGSIFHLQISASTAGPLGPTTFRLTSTGQTSAGPTTEILWVGTVFVSK
jgi:hypothetical protein